ncbi:DUF362 domain-containing protein [Acidaminobacter sp. JC074]|uniref:DUF362 domain-containing protein n=1 Tax=Acidaminobacter sp. JC074 TaxID=2530199 RepID=UPI001F0D7695|nr:DUF362 domain-containing protein [Acidaminobacter sp. JC074]MCH4886124.1 DUF362 domain-containing protein [Acidaminobacter sp. JC074]
MSKVYFKRYEGHDNSVLSAIAKEMLEQLVEKDGHELMKNVPIKVHFGEKGNKTFVPAACYDGIIDYLEENQRETSFIETNVLYRGQRTTKENHINVAKDHGFTRVPIIIADGEMGEAVHEVEINKEYFDKVKIGAAFKDYEQIIVMSHFKGHGLAGFGGALKQLAMGFASRSGKMAQHSRMVPTVNSKKCISCGVCVNKCDVDAITIDEFAEISADKCIGCAGCIAVCPVGAIKNDWGASNFREKITEYAYGAQLNKKHLYITFMINITKDCDCVGEEMHPIAKNFGVLASVDPVALDTACINLLQEEEHVDLFNTGRESLVHAGHIHFGSDKYELIEL